MIDIEATTDPRLLRDLCWAYEKSNRILLDKIQSLAQRLAELEGLDAAQAALELPIVEIPSGGDPDSKPPAHEPQGGALPTARRSRTGHGPTAQAQLPMEIDVCQLPEDKRGCEVCGGHLEEMKGQFEESEEITVVERTVKLVLRRRQKYRCRCNGNVVTAKGPPKLVPGGRYSLDFAIAVALDKYADHLPLERQVRRFARQGLEVTSATLWDQLEALATILEPTWKALHEALLVEPLIHVDETGWRLWEPDQKTPCPWTVWSVSSPEMAYYRLLGSKSAKAARSILSGYSGIVVADGAKAYEKLVREATEPTYRLVNCWAHVLRKFRDAAPKDPRCETILTWIGGLYDVEAKIDGPFPGDEAAQRHRLELRQEKSKPIVEAIREWAFQQGGLRRSDFGRALRYMLERWPALTSFLDNARVPLDNNAAERALRGLVVGRKNHYGSRSRRGTEVAAILYSLIETAKLRGCDPVVYLRQAALAAIGKPGTVTLPG